MAVHFHDQVVIDRLLCRKGKAKANQLVLGALIRELILACKSHSICAVPEEALLAMREIKIDIDAAAAEGQIMRIGEWLRAHDLLPIYLAFHAPLFRLPVARARGKLLLLRPPGRSHLGL